MPMNYQTIDYQDEVLADKTVCRRYNDGRVEWRTRLADGRVEWRDNQSQQGLDELLGDGIIKRNIGSNSPLYGREQGYGRTLWSNNLLTVNRTTFSGKLGALLATMGGAMLLGSLIAPPITLAAEQEAELRRQQAAQQQSDSSGSGSSDGDSWDAESDFGDSGGDFG